MTRPATDRAQANLPALAVALVVLTAVTAVALTVTDGAFARADRAADERRVALSLSDRLVAAGSPLTVRENVLNATALAAIEASAFERSFPATVGTEYAVTLSEERVVANGTPGGGTTVHRIVLVANRSADRIEPSFSGGNEVTLPRRTDRARIRISPGPNTTVRTVRANGRVLLRDPGGLDGTHTVSLSRRETTTLRFGANDRLESGSVTVVIEPLETRKALLGVTVDA